MDVGGDGIGRAAAGDRDFRHGEIETAAAMADVEHHAALLGGERRRQQLAVLHDIGEGAADVRRAGIGVGQHVARPQQVEDLRHQFLGLDAADMHHHLRRPAGHLAGLDAALERLEPVLGDHVLRHPHLDPEQEVRVFRQRHRAGFDLRIVDVVELGDRECRQAVIGDVEEGVDARPRLRHDVAAQRRKIVDAGIAGRDQRGGALELREFVGGNADRRAIGVDMAVQVDQARRHQLAGGVDGLGRARRRNVVFDRLDHAPADADVAFAPQRLAGIEHVAALDDEIELVVRPHRGLRAGRPAPAAAADPDKARKLRRENPRHGRRSPQYDFYGAMMRRCADVAQAARTMGTLPRETECAAARLPSRVAAALHRVSIRSRPRSWANAC